eukprot:COSAG01_NODE_12267_length_1770_cov_0.894075_2_plen_103_part_00
MYVASLAVVAPHRRMGVGRALVGSLLGSLEAAARGPHCWLAGIERVELQVHVANDDALSFYRRVGFGRAARVDNYYPRLQPPHAYLLRRTLHSGAAAEWPPV